MRQEGTNGPTWLKQRYIRVYLPIRSTTRVREEAYTFYAYFIQVDVCINGFINSFKSIIR